MAGPVTVSPERPIRFGDFELNASALELRRGRRTVRLERIPLQVLLLLIEEQGRVVTREAIADQIWGKGVFVDVENGINTAVRKIRQVLNDDPQKPRFVETIPGVGYRFIAPLEKPEAPVHVIDESRDEALRLVVEPERSASAGVRLVAGDADARGGWIRAAAVVLGLLLIAGIGGWVGWRHFTAQRHTMRSIAVIPLQNLSGDSSQEYFSDGMTEELITELSRIESLRVVSHTSVMEYKGTKKRLPEIARELGVDAILEGSVIRENNTVRVTVQLLDGPADRHLWGEEYERPLNGVLNLQRDVAQAVAQEVRARLSATQQARLHEAHAVNPAAYDDYLKGRFYFDNGFWKPDSLRKGQQYFEQSIQADPNFAAAYAGLANTYVYSAFAGVLGRDQAYRSAKAALARAFELDDSVGEAHETLGTLLLKFDWDWEGADREFNRAIALAPSYSCAHESRAGFLAFMGRRDEALAEIAKVDQLDYGLNSVWIESYAYGALPDYPRLIDASRRAMLLGSNDWVPHYNLGLGYEGTGRLQEAIVEYQKAIAMSADPKATVALAHAWSARGKKAEAQKILRDLERKSGGSASPYTMATIYAGLGDNDKAFASLETAYSEKSFDMGNPGADLMLSSLRSDPRLLDLLRRMRLSN